MLNVLLVISLLKQPWCQITTYWVKQKKLVTRFYGRVTGLNNSLFDKITDFMKFLNIIGIVF